MALATALSVMPALKAMARKVVVALKTLTPNFKGYEVQFDGGPWKPSAEKLNWMLRPGANRVAARTVNQFGVRGPVSTADIELAR